MNKKELSSSIINDENPKTIYRDKGGRIIDPSQTKEAKERDLEKRNYENVSLFLSQKIFDLYIKFSACQMGQRLQANRGGKT